MSTSRIQRVWNRVDAQLRAGLQGRKGAEVQKTHKHERIEKKTDVNMFMWKKNPKHSNVFNLEFFICSGNKKMTADLWVWVCLLCSLGFHFKMKTEKKRKQVLYKKIILSWIGKCFVIYFPTFLNKKIFWDETYTDHYLFNFSSFLLCLHLHCVFFLHFFIWSPWFVLSYAVPLTLFLFIFLHYFSASCFYLGHKTSKQ